MTYLSPLGIKVVSHESCSWGVVIAACADVSPDFVGNVIYVSSRVMSTRFHAQLQVTKYICRHSNHEEAMQFEMDLTAFKHCL